MDWSKTFQPLRVRAWLRSPVISDEWLPLDGILFYQAARDQLPPQDVTIPGGVQDGILSKIKMPLEIVGAHTPTWYYKCSWAQWPQTVATGRDYWNKRFDQGFASLVDFGKRRGVISTSSGPMKMYHMPVFYRSALWVEWFCVGNLMEIKILLSACTHIGKKTSQGWGRVWRWDAELQQDDWSIWRDGRLMRGIPAEEVMDKSQPLRLAYYGFRPSYWSKDNQRILAMPHEK